MNKQQRNQIYKLTLKLYTKHINTYKHPYFGLCFMLSEAIDELSIKGNAYNNMKELPEIYKHRPNTIYFKMYWWDLNNTIIRLKVLEQAIQETNE